MIFYLIITDLYTFNIANPIKQLSKVSELTYLPLYIVRHEVLFCLDGSGSGEAAIS